MLAHQTKQVTFLLPKIGTQNETLDSDIKEGCRGGEHLMNKEQDENRSVLKLHAKNHHGGADMRFTMEVTGLHSNSLDRQATEGVNLANFSGDVLMNRRGEIGGV